MIGKHNSLLQKIRSAQGGQKIFVVGCSCHLVHLCAEKQARKLSVNAEDFAIYIIFFAGVQNGKTS